MNVNFEKTDQVNGVLTVKIFEDDYKADVKKELTKLGQTRPIRGFRPGHVPAALLQKFYGQSVKNEIINRLMNRAVSNYIVENKLPILGEPILKEGADLNDQDGAEFELKFDLGLKPEFDLTIDKSIAIPYYNITIWFSPQRYAFFCQRFSFYQKLT